MLDTSFMLWELSVTEQRYRAVLEVLAGVPVTEVADGYGVTRQSVHAWLGRYRSEGPRRGWRTAATRCTRSPSTATSPSRARGTGSWRLSKRVTLVTPRTGSAGSLYFFKGRRCAMTCLEIMTSDTAKPGSKPQAKPETFRSHRPAIVAATTGTVLAAILGSLIGPPGRSPG